MASPITYSAIDDKDFDDAALWAVIDSAVAAAAAAASSSSSSKSRKSLAVNYPSKSNPSPPPRFPKSPRTPYQAQRNSRAFPEGEVVHEPWVFQPPRKIARTCVSEVSESSPLALVGNNTLRTPPAPVYLSPEAYLSPQIASGSEGSPAVSGSGLNEEKEITRHSLSGRFPSVSLFKEYQNAAMAILEKSDYTTIAGNPFIKKSGWRKISFYFNLSFEIKDKTIEFDENRNVQRAEFVVRAYMQGGRFCDGWGSCERREKRFSKPNHDIPSTAETRAKNKACQDLLGIGEYRPGACQGQK
ncbi:uncharacterized protein LOC111014994 [Momordica charantia]|uniref:Uncharacterized protein LOC111014994 n=1 Tax=Momordica charantia TaxID=3673 RepID=A0A6J1CWB4_MOMCH|nr:uncharacterized protein LOC111014994 [Momordica charantia]